MGYEVEAVDTTQEATITVGSRPGYSDTTTPFSLEHVINIVSNAHEHMTSTGRKPIPAIVSQGTLIGRADSGNYREDVYQVNFAWSPRAPPLGAVEFGNTIRAYAEFIGSQLQQKRVYMKSAGNNTIVLKKSD